MPFSNYRLVHKLIGPNGSEKQQLEATLRVTDIRATPQNTRWKPSREFSTGKIDTRGQKRTRVLKVL